MSSQGKLLRHGMSSKQPNHLIVKPSLPRGQTSTQARQQAWLAARLYGRNTNKPNAWSVQSSHTRKPAPDSSRAVTQARMGYLTRASLEWEGHSSISRESLKLLGWVGPFSAAKPAQGNLL